MLRLGDGRWGGCTGGGRFAPDDAVDAVQDALTHTCVVAADVELQFCFAGNDVGGISSMDGADGEDSCGSTRDLA
ncbi:hypothetical protein RQCS_11460 [Rhodococcus qingshengii]|nr:hypothetical protein A0W34_05965 [Rhodococcus sp. BH4]BCF81601.1 hypothetical protein RQCS_11460 [Rhodococcus qingshengii]